MLLTRLSVKIQLILPLVVPPTDLQKSLRSIRIGHRQEFDFKIFYRSRWLRWLEHGPTAIVELVIFLSEMVLREFDGLGPFQPR